MEEGSFGAGRMVQQFSTFPSPLLMNPYVCCHIYFYIDTQCGRRWYCSQLFLPFLEEDCTFMSHLFQPCSLDLCQPMTPMHSVMCRSGRRLQEDYQGVLPLLPTPPKKLREKDTFRKSCFCSLKARIKTCNRAIVDPVIV